MTDTIERSSESPERGEPPLHPPVPVRPVERSNPLRLVALVGSIVALGVWTNWFVVGIVVALLVSIFLHELGHFVVARRSGMLVTEFFIGMGPRIWSIRRGEVEYGFKAIPLGAYVRIVGMHNLEPVDPIDEPRTYRAQNYPRRLATVLAGPAANIVIGVVLFFGVFAFAGNPTPSATENQPWTVDFVVPGSAADAAGVQAGDRLVAVDGVGATSWDDFTELLHERAGERVTVTVERDGEQLELGADLGWGLSESGAEAIPSNPSLLPGTQVIVIDDTEVSDYAETRELLAEEGPDVTVQLDTGRGIYELDVQRPLELPDDGATGFLGVSRSPDPVQTGLAEAATDAVAMVPMTAQGMGEVLGRLFSPSGMARYAEMVASGGSSPDSGDGAVSSVPRPRAVAGAEPIAERPDIPEERIISIFGIVGLGGQIGDAAGWAGLVVLLASVNIFLALINLLPLLPFDGGHATVATYEAARGAVTRRPHRVDMNKLMPITYVVVFLLLALGLSAIYLDVVNPIQLTVGGSP